MAKFFRASPEKKSMIKKNEISLNLEIGDRIVVKTKEKGRWAKRKTTGEVILNQKEHPFFLIDTGKSRTSFLKIDALIGAIEIKKIS